MCIRPRMTWKANWLESQMFSPSQISPVPTDQPRQSGRYEWFVWTPVKNLYSGVNAAADASCQCVSTRCEPSIQPINYLTGKYNCKNSHRRVSSPAFLDPLVRGFLRKDQQQAIRSHAIRCLDSFLWNWPNSTLENLQRLWGTLDSGFYAFKQNWSKYSLWGTKTHSAKYHRDEHTQWISRQQLFSFRTRKRHTHLTMKRKAIRY